MIATKDKDKAKLVKEIAFKSLTPVGRANLVKRLVGEVRLPIEYIEEAVEFFSIGHGNDAIIKEGQGIGITHSYLDAARIAKKGGLDEKAKELYETIISDMESEGFGVARIQEEAGMYEDAIRSYISEHRG